MQISTGTTSHRSINQATKNVIKDVIEDINGTPDFVLVAFTSNYRQSDEYKQALSKICEESGTTNVMGGTFPGVATSNELPTTQGCSLMAIKSSEISFEKPFSYSNVRINPKKGSEIIFDAYQKQKNKSKIGFFLTPGPLYQDDAFEQMKILDTIFAKKFKGMFNFIGKIIDKSMGKGGYGGTLFAEKILHMLLNQGVENILGGATIDLDMKACYQFSGEEIFRNALVGTVFSSDKYEFGHGWTFDRSQKSKKFDISGFLKSSGYIQYINERSANREFRDIIGISEELYEEAFGNFAYASLLYLSALKKPNKEYVPFVSVCHPILDGVVTTIPERYLNENKIIADFFTQSGTGIQKSAYDCATNISKNLENLKFGIFINCSNRLLIAGDKIDKENMKIKEALGDEVPFITLYSGGEFSLIGNNPVYSSVSVHGIVAGENKVPIKNVVF